MAAAPCPLNGHNLRNYNTFRLPATAHYFVSYDGSWPLSHLGPLVQQHPQVFVLGGGSNCIFSAQIQRLVVHVATRGIRLLAETASAYVVEAEAGENWHNFVRFCLQQGWYGLENLALIPGTVGAAPVQNIGAYGVELDQRLHSLQAWNILQNKFFELHPHECRFSYRDSFFKQAPQGEWLITKVRFALPKQWQPQLAYPDLAQHPLLQKPSEVTAHKVFDAVCDVRRRKLPDPDVLPNAGSFFKNPVVSQDKYQGLFERFPSLPAYEQGDGSYKLPAAWLIDQAGWKGRRVGAVGMHERQALVMVNYGGADVGQVVRLAQAIREDVQRRYGVVLEQEPVGVS